MNGVRMNLLRSAGFRSEVPFRMKTCRLLPNCSSSQVASFVFFAALQFSLSLTVWADFPGGFNRQEVNHADSSVFRNFPNGVVHASSSVSALSAVGRSEKRNWGQVISFELIHRHHPSRSPLRNPHSSPESLMHESLRRSMIRFHALSKQSRASAAAARNGSLLVREFFSTSVEAPQGNWQGEFFIKLQLGTPAQDVLLIIDTGSEITWTQCDPCPQCYSQILPVFNPQMSSSYNQVSCLSSTCNSQVGFQCSLNTTCEYGVRYSDDSFSTGVVSQDILTVNSMSSSLVHVQRLLFGCGLYNVGDFVGNSGMLGLSRGPVSFPLQLAGLMNYSKKFAYCFADVVRNPNATGNIYFGEIARSLTHRMKHTPLVPTPFPTQFYYVNLTGVSVGKHHLPIDPSLFALTDEGLGGTVMDSATTVTLIPPSAYAILRNAIRAACAARGFKPAPGFNTTGYEIDTCYQFPPNSTSSSSFHTPTITLHLQNVDLPLHHHKVLFPFDNSGCYCLAIASTMSPQSLSIIGNIQQQDFRILYDLQSSTIGFSKARCGR